LIEEQERFAAMRRRAAARAEGRPEDDDPEDEVFWAREEVLLANEAQRREHMMAWGEAWALAELEALPRDAIVLSADVVVLGPVADGIGVEGFVAQERQRSGE